MIHIKGNSILIIVFTELSIILLTAENFRFDNVLMGMNTLPIIMNFAWTSFSLQMFQTLSPFHYSTTQCTVSQILLLSSVLGHSLPREIVFVLVSTTSYIPGYFLFYRLLLSHQLCGLQAFSFILTVL